MKKILVLLAIACPIVAYAITKNKSSKNNNDAMAGVEYVEKYLKERVSNYRVVSKTLNYKIVLSITSHLMRMFNSSKIKSFIHQSIILSL